MSKEAKPAKEPKKITKIITDVKMVRMKEGAYILEVSSVPVNEILIDGGTVKIIKITGEESTESKIVEESISAIFHGLGSDP